MDVEAQEYREIGGSCRVIQRGGIQEARDLGAPLERVLFIREAIRKGDTPGPTLYVSGPFIRHEPYPGTATSAGT